MIYLCFVLFSSWVIIGPIFLEYIWDETFWCPSLFIIPQQQQHQQQVLNHESTRLLQYRHSHKQQEQQEGEEEKEEVHSSSTWIRNMKSSGDHNTHHYPSTMIYIHGQQQQEGEDEEESVNPEYHKIQQQSPYENPDYDTNTCRYQRLPLLFYLTLEEADLCTRLIVAVFMGAFIGYERRSTDRPAGIRTMGLVSLGSCFFTISSELAFKSSPMNWDASRVTAAIPSGVGFIGTSLIWKVCIYNFKFCYFMINVTHAYFVFCRPPFFGIGYNPRTW